MSKLNLKVVVVVLAMVSLIHRKYYTHFSQQLYYDYFKWCISCFHLSLLKFETGWCLAKLISSEFYLDLILCPQFFFLYLQLCVSELVLGIGNLQEESDSERTETDNEEMTLSKLKRRRVNGKLTVTVSHFPHLLEGIFLCFPLNFYLFLITRRHICFFQCSIKPTFWILPLNLFNSIQFMVLYFHNMWHSRVDWNLIVQLISQSSSSYWEKDTSRSS